MADAVNKLKLFSQEEIDSYWPDMYEKAELDRKAELSYARKEGISIGKQEGISIGEKRGEKRGISETALNLLALGVDTEIISKATSLSKEDILNLKNNEK